MMKYVFVLIAVFAGLASGIDGFSGTAKTGNFPVDHLRETTTSNYNTLLPSDQMKRALEPEDEGNKDVPGDDEDEEVQGLTTDDGKSKDKPGTPPGGGDVLAPALATVAAVVVVGLGSVIFVLARKLQRANKEIARLSEIASRVSGVELEATGKPEPEL